MAYDGRAVANLILNTADELHFCITPMALQKIAFFAHGWYVATHREPLIKQPFEAWQHGPVVRVVYEAFGRIGDAPITIRAKRLDPVTRVEATVPADLADDDAAFVHQIVRRYGPVHAAELRRLTHLPGTPWHRVWHAPAGKVTLGMRISDEAIQAFFLGEMRLN